jgi:hypothetical protein
MLMAVGFVPDIHEATAAEFDRAARENTFAFWFWAGSAVFVWWVTSVWWAAIPAVVAIHAAAAWVSCRRNELRLRLAEHRLREGMHVNTGKAATDRLAA